MVVVKNQDLPLDEIEDKVDPPIPFIESYKRVLGEGIDHPELPAGEEIVTGRKTESRPGTRSSSEFSKPPDREAWRDIFKACLACWERQFDTEEDLDPCMSASHRRYVKDWNYVPGAKDTYFNTFMSDCLNWAKINPGEPMPECEDLNVSASDYEFCINGQILFNAGNGNNVVIKSVECGEIVDPMLWQAPPDYETCPEEVTVYFEDDDGRKGCVILTKMSELECCCDLNPEIEITYTSLQMGVGESQELGLNPDAQGCEPYHWSLTGGGELSETEGPTTTYTAPATNPNCTNNPTITVTDSCENEAEVKFAVNAVSGNTRAGGYNNILECEGGFFNSWGCDQGFYNCWDWIIDAWRCDGESVYHCESRPCGTYEACTNPPLGNPGVTKGYCYGNTFPPEECFTAQCLTGCGNFAGACFQTDDCRTQQMKDAGCCPINYVTGLPQ